MSTWKTRIFDGDPKIAADLQGAGAPVVFLHGLGGNRTNWHDQLPYFAEFATAIAWDARGYGESGDYDGPYTFTDVSDDLARLLDQIAAPKAHLVGLSMGGRIALEFSGRYPERVSSITFAATSARPGQPPTASERDEGLRLRRQPFVDGSGPKGMAENMLPNLVSAQATDDMRQRIYDSLITIHPECYLKSVETVVSYAGFPPFSSIGAPCLVITGTADKLATPDYARTIADQIPDSQLVILEGPGHLCNIEAPAEFNRAVGNFIKSHISTTAE